MYSNLYEQLKSELGDNIENVYMSSLNVNK
jgi:hypothetical protein